VIKWTAPVPDSFWRQPVILGAVLWLIIAGLVTVSAPIFAPEGPLVTDSSQSLLPPGPGKWLGTDLLGRDVLTRLIWGGRWSLGMGLAGLAITVGLGLPVGLVAATFGGWLEAALMRGVDALLAFPGLLLAMAVVTILGPGITSVTVAVGLAAAPGYARVVRSSALEVRTELYVLSARATGCGEGRILIRYIFPNAIAPLIAFATTQLGWILLNGAALNFLGLGVTPGTPEWGNMLVEGRAYLRDAPWVSSFPGLALALTVLSANLLGDRLQATLWPG